ncbi:alpha/beta hydrolase [Streptacidiphilus fuscans]|uniref:Alpha/beta hydrolase n=1 Tax=Streptacidiphilus fuscans TaxID=2789292 RepID=A0A931B1Q1_9ACTN|nr:alpha/beta hydrolase [Streptacidiphilus fuscans]MBF9069479.1 alpha/beta hydrolase [Streptacidiphilus fuscans]
MLESVQREKVRFSSGGEECAAWFYPGTNGACVVMAGGFAVPKEPGTDRFARRFQQAGFSALGFDYRRLGESGGTPRLVLGMRDHVADWLAAIAYVRTLPGVDPDRVGLWGFSASGGLVMEVVARCPEVAAVVAQSANVGGLAAARAPARYQKPGAMLRLLGRGVRDALGGLVGREPLLVPLAGAPGTVALLSTPDGWVVPHPLDPDGRYSQWRQAVAARSALAMPLHRSGSAAARVRCPLLAVVCDQDRTAPPEATIAAVERAPRGEVVSVPGGHYAPFLDAHEQAVREELAFLERHLVR